MAATYQEYVDLVRQEVEKNSKRDYLAQVLPGIRSIRTQAEKNAALLEYFNGVDRQLVQWVGNLPRDHKPVQDFAAGLGQSFQNLALLKGQLDQLQTVKMPDSFKPVFAKLVSDARETMTFDQLNQYFGSVERLKSEIQAHEQMLKQQEAERKRQAEEARLRKQKEEEEAEQRRKQEEAARRRREAEAERRRQEEAEAERQRLAREKEEQTERIIKYVLYGLGAIAAVLLIIYVIIPVVVAVVKFVVDVLTFLFTVVLPIAAGIGLIYLLYRIFGKN